MAIKPAAFLEIMDILNTVDSPANAPPFASSDSVVDSTFANAVSEYFAGGREELKTVLGLDIYKYSEFAAESQRLVPVIFRLIYGMACSLVVMREPMLFAEEDFQATFISTGDGGFQIFDTPLQGIIFAAAVQVALSAYNTAIIYPRTRGFVGGLTMRYALTRDLVYRLDDNWFGSGIISNARILSRDHLNRFLVDGHTVAWFDKTFGSVESLLIQQKDDIKRFAQDTAKAQSAESMFFDAKGDNSLPQNCFRALDLQRIGTVTAKGRPLEVFNLHLQIMIRNILESRGINRQSIVTLGNLNAEGISA